MAKVKQGEELENKTNITIEENKNISIDNKRKLPVKSKVKALIYYSNEIQPEQVEIKDFNENFFTYKNRAYNIDFQDVMFFKKPNLIWGNTYYLFYFYDNYRPLRIDESLSHISQKMVNNSVINSALKTKAIEKANDIKKGFELNDTMIYLIIGGGILLVLFFIFGGGQNV